MTSTTRTLRRKMSAKRLVLHIRLQKSLSGGSRDTFGRYFSYFLTKFLAWEKVCNAICFLHWTAKIILRTLAAPGCTATYRQSRVAKNITRHRLQQPSGDHDRHSDPDACADQESPRTAKNLTRHRRQQPNAQLHNYGAAVTPR